MVGFAEAVKRIKDDVDVAIRMDKEDGPYQFASEEEKQVALYHHFIFACYKMTVLCTTLHAHDDQTSHALGKEFNNFFEVKQGLKTSKKFSKALLKNDWVEIDGRRYTLPGGRTGKGFGIFTFMRESIGR